MTNDHQILRVVTGDRGDVAVFERPAIDSMARMLPAQSKEIVMEVLGISANTWLKIKRQQPIRASIATRLAERLSELPKRGF